MAEKQEPPNIFTLQFWQHAITQAFHAMSAALAGPLAAHASGMIDSLPWYAMLTSAGSGGLLSLIMSLGGNTMPNRVPGSFLPETEEEKRIHRMVEQDQRVRENRERLRGREESRQMDRHRNEPEDDDHLISGVPPPRRESPPAQHIPHEQPMAPGWRDVSREPQSESELPYRERERKPSEEIGPQSVPGPSVPPARPRTTHETDMEEWPQGGRRGKSEQ